MKIATLLIAGVAATVTASPIDLGKKNNQAVPGVWPSVIDGTIQGEINNANPWLKGHQEYDEYPTNLHVKRQPKQSNEVDFEWVVNELSKTIDDVLHKALQSIITDVTKSWIQRHVLRYDYDKEVEEEAAAKKAKAAREAWKARHPGMRPPINIPPKPEPAEEETEEEVVEPEPREEFTLTEEQYNNLRFPKAEPAVEEPASAEEPAAPEEPAPEEPVTLQPVPGNSGQFEPVPAEELAPAEPAGPAPALAAPAPEPAVDEDSFAYNFMSLFGPQPGGGGRSGIEEEITEEEIAEEEIAEEEIVEEPIVEEAIVDKRGLAYNDDAARLAAITKSLEDLKSTWKGPTQKTMDLGDRVIQQMHDQLMQDSPDSVEDRVRKVIYDSVGKSV